MIKHALNQLNKMADITGERFEKEKNILLDRLIVLEKMKKNIEK